MKPPSVAYRRPESLAEALADLAELGDRARPLAGGQSLVPLLALRLAQPEVLVGLERVAELRGAELAADQLVIRAMTREAELERAPALPALLRAALGHIGHFQIRSRGTVGGSLAHMDPAAEWPALALLLDATLTVASTRRGRRRLPAAAFIVGPLTTALEPDELLEAVTIARPDDHFGFAEVERRSGDFALVGAGCHGGRVVVFAAGPRPQRLAGVEAFLRDGGGPGPELQQRARAEIEARDDLHASAAYRRQVGARLVDQVVAAAS
ncbi:MAG TPA: FAD binding domain-containing protein [Candidatus Dormibacteraeota bacterium]|nr:FAD binding domain-containing protein [Candidatus Dormibacteraeota bacterium]